jgi:hypothetical protein
MDNEIDRLTLITSDVTMRGRRVGFHSQYPRNPARQFTVSTQICLNNMGIGRRHCLL